MACGSIRGSITSIDLCMHLNKENGDGYAASRGDRSAMAKNSTNHKGYLPQVLGT